VADAVANSTLVVLMVVVEVVQVETVDLYGLR